MFIFSQLYLELWKGFSSGQFKVCIFFTGDEVVTPPVAPQFGTHSPTSCRCRVETIGGILGNENVPFLRQNRLKR